ncbi:MAG: hypothetical protein Q8N81_07180 [bacterium]|nr:hypothetical protein [bacterium]
MIFNRLQNIGSILQTGFEEAFSDACLDAISQGVVGMLAAIFFPVSGMRRYPVIEIAADDALVLSYPASFACALLLFLTVGVSAGDLTITEARVGEERRLAEYAEFFFFS